MVFCRKWVFFNTVVTSKFMFYITTEMSHHATSKAFFVFNSSVQNITMSISKRLYLLITIITQVLLCWNRIRVVTFYAKSYRPPFFIVLLNSWHLYSTHRPNNKLTQRKRGTNWLLMSVLKLFISTAYSNVQTTYSFIPVLIVLKMSLIIVLL